MRTKREKPEQNPDVERSFIHENRAPSSSPPVVGRIVDVTPHQSPPGSVFVEAEPNPRLVGNKLRTLIRQGGSSPYRSVIIPALDPGDRTGAGVVVWFRRMSGKQLIEFASGQDDNLTGSEGINKAIDFLSTTLVDPDTGLDLMTREELLDSPVDTIMAIFEAIVGTMTSTRTEVGEDSNAPQSSN